MVVLDSSAFLSMVFADERAPETPAMERQLESGGAVVPALWLAEIQNVLVVAQKSRRLDRASAAAVIALARSAQIEVDPVGPELTFGSESSLAHSFGLSVYDAVYLELAQRRGLPLMTLDRSLKAAAESLGLAWQPGYSAIVAARRKQRGPRRGSGAFTRRASARRH